MAVSGGCYLSTRHRYCVHHHLSAIRSCGGSSAEWWRGLAQVPRRKDDGLDRKSTRLNSSHVAISYAVFCLKKKTLSVFPPTAISPVNLCQHAPLHVWVPA